MDPGLPIYQNELLILVDQLNLDSASMRQLAGAQRGDADRIAGAVLDIVRERGKMQNPETGSGGMLLGEVLQIGEQCPHPFELGDRVATLVSLTLTPLHLEKVFAVEMPSGHVHVKGHAILFPSGCAARLPADFPEALSLSLLDVAGAASWAKKVLRPGDRLLIVGAGKSGALAAAAARELLPAERIWVSDANAGPLQRLKETGAAGHVFPADAQDPLGFAAALRRFGAPPFDWVFNTANAPETEMACILAVRPKGKVLFFNMTTQFSRAVLSAEGISKEIEMLMGEGFVEGHGDYAFYLVRNHPWLRRWFET
ncbi:MAG: L-erythro-3,5-diaminohexanoate dehydrogenase [Candidatus Binatia bacterium]